MIMEIDEELKNLIAEYVRQIEAREDDLLGLQRNIDGITNTAKNELQKVTNQLDNKFDANEISEEEYLIQFRAAKADILKSTQGKMDALLTQYEKTYGALETS